MKHTSLLNRTAVLTAVALMLMPAGMPEAAARKRPKKNAEPVPVKVQTNDKGYYKDIWMDSGIGVSSRKDLPAARYLGLEIEALVTAPKKELSFVDTVVQNEVLLGNPLDENGILLYPDGAPRFRCIYMNGGNAQALSRPLGDRGRQIFKDFIHGGGSYVGSCAGAFFATQYKLMDDGVKDYGPNYIGIWPGVVRNSNVTDKRHGVRIEPGSPLLKYYDFGGDNYVAEVYHNGGCYGIVDTLWPAAGEVLARYDISMLDPQPKRKFDGTPVIWSVKEKEEWGRVISCGSHPEGATSGDRLHLMSAMLLYAMEGNAPAHTKGALVFGEPRRMDKATHDNDPAYTRIGDRQYHHFTVEVPAGIDTLNIQLSGVAAETDFDLYLFANPDDFAFRENARYQSISLGMKKNLAIPAPKPGTYYISVFCATTVTAIETDKGTRYMGRVDVLNGVPYEIKVWH